MKKNLFRKKAMPTQRHIHKKPVAGRVSKSARKPASVKGKKLVQEKSIDQKAHRPEFVDVTIARIDFGARVFQPTAQRELTFRVYESALQRFLEKVSSKFASPDGAAGLDGALVNAQRTVCGRQLSFGRKQDRRTKGELIRDSVSEMDAAAWLRGTVYGNPNFTPGECELIRALRMGDIPAVEKMIQARKVWSHDSELAELLRLYWWGASGLFGLCWFSGEALIEVLSAWGCPEYHLPKLIKGMPLKAWANAKEHREKIIPAFKVLRSEAGLKSLSVVRRVEFIEAAGGRKIAVVK